MITATVNHPMPLARRDGTNSLTFVGASWRRWTIPACPTRTSYGSSDDPSYARRRMAHDAARAAWQAQAAGRN
jgi:hypothetical protein